MAYLNDGFWGNVIVACFFGAIAWTQTNRQRAIQDPLLNHAALFYRYERNRRVPDMQPHARLYGIAHFLTELERNIYQ